LCQFAIYWLNNVIVSKVIPFSLLPPVSLVLDKCRGEPYVRPQTITEIEPIIEINVVRTNVFRKLGSPCFIFLPPSFGYALCLVSEPRALASGIVNKPQILVSEPRALASGIVNKEFSNINILILS
jgi:hypothetical protein